MDFSPILNNVAKHIRLSDEEISFFTSLLKPAHIKHKDHIHFEGEICRHTAFVVKGCMRGYTIDKHGVEHLLSFAPPGWWISDIYSYISEQPGQLNIQAIDESDVFLISKTDQNLLYEKVPKFERFFRILIENAMVATQQRLIDNLSLSAEERYNNFCNKYPMLINSVPQKYVASFIGVTPEFLSKMRSRMLRESK